MTSRLPKWMDWIWPHSLARQIALVIALALLAAQIEESVMWRADVSVMSPTWRVKKGFVRTCWIRVRFW